MKIVVAGTPFPPLVGRERILFLSSLGGHEDERIVRDSGARWTILRAGPVYGPHDDLVAPLLKMVRTLPVIFLDGDQELQPIWHEDLETILAAVMQRNDLDGQILDAPGPEITTTNDLVDRLREITGRAPLRLSLPIHRPPLVKTPGLKNAAEVLGVSMTPLDHGLRLLADSLPEQTPDRGVGALEHKRFSAEITGSRLSAAALMTYFRNHVTDFMPLEFSAEPGAPTRIEKGATMTGKLPLRGHFQVRVEVAEPRHGVFATIEGHPLAGIVEFTTDETARGIRFAIDVFSRASNWIDWLAVKTLGEIAQGANWTIVVQRVIDASGGTSDGVQVERRVLKKEEAAAVEERVLSLPEHSP